MSAAPGTARPRPALWTALVRGIGPWAGLAAALLLAAHVAFRPWEWAHEWRMVAWQYAFALVMVGPVAAGFSAREAGQVRKRGVDVLAAGRSRQALALAVWSVASWTIAAFALGALVVVTYTFVVGAPGGPAPRDLVPFLLGALSVVFFCSVGALAGWRIPSMLTAPLTASVLFACTAILYGTDLSFVVDLGGSSSSLLGLVPNADRQLLQAVFFVLAATAALWAAGGDPYRSRRSTGAAVALGATTVLLVVMGAVAAPERLVPTADDEMVCLSSDRGVRVCLGPGYSDRLPGITSALDGPVGKLEEAGISVPRVFDQRYGYPGTAYVDVNLLDQGPSAPAQTVVGLLVPQTCDLLASAAALDSYSALAWWLSPESSDSDSLWPADQLPETLRDGDPAAQHTEVRRIVGDLSACSGAQAL